MVRRWDLAIVKKEMTCASLYMGSMRDQVSMRDSPPLGDALGGFIYVAS
jgi:hypothetical protein